MRPFSTDEGLMQSTTAIAIYGAVMSTVALIWNISRDVVNARRRVQLVLTDESSVYIGDQVVQIMMALRVTNVSATRDVEIVAVELEGGSLAWHSAGAQTPGGVRPATEDDALPKLLSPSQSVSLSIYLDSLNVPKFEEITKIVVEDSAQRKYRLSEKQLRAMKEWVRRAVTSAGGGEPGSLRVQSRPN
jgi:hypothetical protein